MKKFTVGNILFYLGTTAIIVFLVLKIKELGTASQNVPGIAFAMSVVASILASLLYQYVQEQFLDTKQDEQFKVLQDTTKTLTDTLQDTTSTLSNTFKDTAKSLSDTLQNTTDILSDMQTKGVLRLKKRDEYPDEFWADFIRAANGRLILSGKTLYKWIEHSDLKEAFKTTIIKKLNEGCNVIFVMYKLDSLDTNDAVERKTVKHFLFDEVFPSLYANGNEPKGKFEIKEKDILPYFYITNDIESLAMPYFAKVSNEGNLTYGLKSGSGLDKSYLTDYSHIINTADCNKWIEEYKNGEDPDTEFN